MSEEKKNNRNSKIESFDIPPEKLLDSEMDEALRRELMQEADDLEAKLNSDPELVGVGASEDLFASIVGQLKDQGVWEEDEEEPRKDNLEKLYQMLPEEDRKALELGRQVQEQGKKKARKLKKRRKVYRFAGAAAAMLVLVCGMGMSTEANRKVALQAWNAVMENFGFRTYTDSVEGTLTARSKSEEEIKAYEEISEKLGIGGIDFAYMPEGMEFVDYICDLNMWEATFFYSYKESLINIKIMNINKEGATYLSTDNQTVKIDSFIGKQSTEIEIWETNISSANEEKKTYIGKAEYNDCRCIINGKIEFDELKKIMEWMIFL